MREIKFRAWDKISKKMYYNDLLIDSDFRIKSEGTHNHYNWSMYMGAGQRVNSCDGILMQYTGLKDKNGKPIYEGDIISWHDNGKGRNVEVLWKYGSWQVDKELSLSLFHYDEYIGEVIGNIYENPELLK